MQEIYNLGARSFWIHNTGPIGCLPYILTNFLSAERDSHGCAKPYNEVAQYFNQKLKEAVVQLRNDLPLAAMTYVDIYSVKYSLYSNPEKFGKRKMFMFFLSFLCVSQSPSIFMERETDTGGTKI